MKQAALLSVAALSLLLPRVASAQSAASHIAHHEDRGPRAPFGLTIAGTAGSAIGTRASFTAGVEGMLRYRIVTAGILYEAGVEPVIFARNGRFNTLGGEAGVTLGGASGWRIDMLAVAGVHDYSHIGSTGGLLAPVEPGVDGSTPFVGTRINLSYRWRTAPITLGATAFFHQDLDVRSVTWSHTEDNLCVFACDSSRPSQQTVESSTTIGEYQFGLALRLAVETNFGS